jgi:hypothetical protein
VHRIRNYYRMKNKSRKTPFKRPLQEIELIEVTDPGEFAAFERRVRAAEKVMAAREKALTALENSRKPKSRKGK